MERFSRGDQACILAAAAAHDFNNELTVILSSIATMIDELGPDHPATARALELQDAARRCACKTSSLLRYGSKHGPRVARASLERLIEGD